MKFSIITPTYKRSVEVSHAIESVLNQTYTNWEMIIVNDSPHDLSYAIAENNIADPRIIYFKNEKNEGVNYSRNRALDNVSRDSNWVIFLDDDDYFAPDALASFHKLITEHPHKKWFVTNRAYKNGEALTRFPKNDHAYSYAWDYLILKKGKGDATHCIQTKLLSTIRFSKYLKQAEEWLFFFQVGLKSPLFYHSHNSTTTQGYDKSNGLNFRRRTKMEQLTVLRTIVTEGFQLHLFRHPSFIVYLFLRSVRMCIKS